MNTVVDKIIQQNNAHPSWHGLLSDALAQMDPQYLKNLSQKQQWLPGMGQLLNAFSIPSHQINYLILGESPYPRAQSANGYAFWDDNVGSLWSETGLSKEVNRATSLRNFIKMLLVARGSLSPKETGQAAIASVEKSQIIQTNSELFTGMINQGFLLLNASLVLSEQKVRVEASHWQPFIAHILRNFLSKNQHVTLILFGKIANAVDCLKDLPNTPRLCAEHPYNISFIYNQKIIEFFRPLNLLEQT